MIRTRCVRRRHVGGGLLGVLATAALAGCAVEAKPAGPAASVDTPTPSGFYSCLGTPIPVDALTDPQPATALAEDDHPALSGHEVPGIDLADWTIASAGDDEVVLLRELTEAEDLGAGDIRTHERMVISVVDAPNVPSSPAWMMTALGSCSLAADVPGAGTALVTLDPAEPPDPASTEVRLLVTEFACNSGQDAEGRVDVVSLRETDTAVAVVIAVQPRSGNATCPSNPPTPFTLTLDAPLGDRELLDGSVVPARPVAMPTG